MLYIASSNGKQLVRYNNALSFYKVNKGSFFPIPKVDSAVLKISNINSNNFINKEHEINFFNTVKAGFAHKRKFLISNLKEKINNKNWISLFKENNMDEKIRAEDVVLEKWLNISK